MESLINYSEQELSLRVFNDEVLYNLRHNQEALFNVLDETFIYTEEQKKELLNDIEEDLKEDE